jgi:hypothetical protein
VGEGVYIDGGVPKSHVTAPERARKGAERRGIGFCGPMRGLGA